MRVIQTGYSDLLVIEPEVFKDERGFFLECFQEERYREAGIVDRFVQDNHSRSVKGVLRGLHFQWRNPQAQIVTVLRGGIFDVAVDLRPKSSTFRKTFTIQLGDGGPRQLYMAAGFAHGFCVLTDFADLHYKVSRSYDPRTEAGLVWNDADLAIDWPIDRPIVSERDASFPTLRSLDAADFPDPVS
jgi:dTDP-4-dehydrorhamnose 3,5-epimerase